MAVVAAEEAAAGEAEGVMVVPVDRRGWARTGG